jgi:hypothetical protein
MIESSEATRADSVDRFSSELLYGMFFTRLPSKCKVVARLSEFGLHELDECTVNVALC